MGKVLPHARDRKARKWQTHFHTFLGVLDGVAACGLE
jgi:hypothetical protein